MPSLTASTAANDAAEAFYGLSDVAFAEQLELLGATDPRLVKAFQRTRETYLQQKKSRDDDAR